MSAFEWSPGGCCCVVAGPWDWYHDYHTVSPGPETPGTEFIARTAAIYPGSNAGNPDDFDSYSDWYVEIEDDNFAHKVLASTIAPFGSSGERAYAYMIDALDHRQNITFRFINDEQDFDDQDDSTDIIFEWDAGRFIKFRTEADPLATPQTETALLTGITWEDLGVPVGATIVGVSVASLRRRVFAVTDTLTSHTLKVRLLGGPSPLLLLNDTTLPITTGAYATVNGTGEQAVDASIDSSADSIEIELEYAFILSGAGSDPMQVDIDDLQFTVHHQGTDLNGYCGFNPASQSVLWTANDYDWADLSWSDAGGNPNEGAQPIGIVNISMFSSGQAYTVTWDNGVDANGAHAHAHGLHRWRLGEVLIFGNTHTQSEEWQVDDGGALSYAFNTLHIEDGSENPWVPYAYFLGIPWHNDIDTSEYFNAVLYDYYKPVAAAPQADMAVGIKYSHLPGMADNPLTIFDPFTAVLEVAVGTVLFDEDGVPYVAGATVYIKEQDDYHVNNVEPIATNVSIYGRVDQFDALSGSRNVVTLGTTTYLDFYDSDPPNGYWLAGAYTSTEVLVVDTSEIGEETLVQYNLILDDYVEDNRNFYPHWHNPRTIQNSEDGGKRTVVFSRIPFDQGEADADYGGSSAIHQFKLWMYDSSGMSVGVDWALVSRFGTFSHAAGEVTFTTSNSATLNFAAVSGGNADGDEGNSFNGVELHQSTSERTDYDTGTHLLHVYIDIAGGHDTIAHLMAIIHLGGDFQATAGTFDTDTITAGDTGSPTVPFTGGSDSASTINPYPTVHDSSDRYFYLSGFPALVYDTVDNGIGGTVRKACFPNGTPDGGYPVYWRVSHDGDQWSPCGKGDAEWSRQPPSGASGVGDTNYSCIKNGGMVLAPDLEGEEAN